MTKEPSNPWCCPSHPKRTSSWSYIAWICLLSDLISPILCEGGWAGGLHPLRLLPDRKIAAMKRTNFCSWVNGMCSSLVKPLAEQAFSPSKCKIFRCLYRPVDAILFSVLSWIYRIDIEANNKFSNTRIVYFSSPCKSDAYCKYHIN